MWCGEAHKTLSVSLTCVGRDMHHSRSLPTFLSLEITYFLDKLNNHFLELLLSQLVSACAGRSPNSSTTHHGSQGGTSTMPDWRLSCTVRQKGWTTALQMFSVPPLKDKWSLGCHCLRRALVKHQLISSCSKVHQRLPCHSGCLSCLLSLLTCHGSAGASHQCTGELSSFHPCLHPIVLQYHLWVLGCFWYCTWFIDGVGCLHASMDVIGHVAVQKPRPRVFCYKFNCLESPREKVIYISSVVLICLWQSKTRIVRVMPQILPHGHWNIPVRIPAP